MNNETLMQNPYIGPRTFTEAERDRFFGRAKEARDLQALILTERLVIFYAQSGAGKSSLLNTSIKPSLKEEEGFLVLPTGRVSGELPAGIETVSNIFTFNLIMSLDESHHDPAKFVDMTLPDFLSNLATDDGETYYYDDSSNGNEDEDSEEYETPPHILFIDQFEEIINTHLDKWSEREAFFEQLNEAMLADPMLWVVLTMREDYLARLQPYSRLMSNNMRARYYMKRMESPAAREAIREPARLGGRPFADGVAQTLIDSLRQIRVQGEEERQTGQFVEPVQLQVVCYQLWQNLQDRPLAPITQADVQELGNVEKALSQFYEQALKNTVQQTKISEIELRNWFEQQLITEAKTRSTVYYGRNRTATLNNNIVHVLENQFLIRSDTRAGGRWYELVHDSLIEPIIQANQEWRINHPLIYNAQKWVDSNQTDETLLYTGAQLETAVATQMGMGYPVTDFLQAGLDAEKARQEALAARIKGMRQKLAYVVIGIFVIATVFAGIIFTQGKEDEEDFVKRTIQNQILQTQQYINNYVQSPPLFNQLNNAVYRSGNLQPNDFAQLERLFWELVQLNQYVPGVSFGGVDGTYAGVFETEDGYESRIRESDEGGRTYYTLGEEGRRLEVSGEEDSYDPRDRAWYQTAVATGDLSWSPVYVTAATDQLAISSVQPVYDHSNELVGVTATIFLLDEIDDYLADSVADVNSFLAVIDESGQLIATSSDTDLSITNEDGQIEPVKMIESEDPLVSAIGEVIEDVLSDEIHESPLPNNAEDTENFTKPPRPAELKDSFTLPDQKTYYIETREVHSVGGLAWKIVAAVEQESNLNIFLESNAYIILGIGYLIGIIVLLVGSAFIRGFKIQAEP